jgi:hypothetical protein
MDLQENMRAANQRTLEWVTSMHESILDATKSYVASFAKSAPEPPTWTGPQVASAPDLKQLIEDSYDFQARMLEENKKFSLALADAWAAAAPTRMPSSRRSSNPLVRSAAGDTRRPSPNLAWLVASADASRTSRARR